MYRYRERRCSRTAALFQCPRRPAYAGRYAAQLVQCPTPTDSDCQVMARRVIRAYGRWQCPEALMPNLIAELEHDHVNFEKLLAVLTEELDTLRQGDPPDYDLLLDGLEYFEGYADRVHHPREERMFALCLARAGDYAGEIRAIMAEHQRLQAIAEQVHTSLDGLLHGAITPRVDVQATLEELIHVLRRHIRLENEVLFPHAHAILLAEDWTQLETEFPTHEDPLFGVRAGDEFCNLYQRIMGGERI